MHNPCKKTTALAGANRPAGTSMVTKGDRDVETMQEQRGACTVERGRTGDVMPVTGVRGHWGQRWNKSGQCPVLSVGLSVASWSLYRCQHQPCPTSPLPPL